MPLTLKMQKPGEEAPKLHLSMNKGARFVIELYWESHDDLDTHALLATNSGQGAKITAFEQVLSCYNLKSNGGVLIKDAKGSFATPCGALQHSGDCRDGATQDVDETITFDGSKILNGINEVPIVVTIHKAMETGSNFSRVKTAGIRIKDEAGKILAEYSLSNEFGAFNAVQFGSLVHSDKGWEFAAIGAGFNGDFNTVLGSFS